MAKHQSLAEVMPLPAAISRRLLHCTGSLGPLDFLQTHLFRQPVAQRRSAPQRPGDDVIDHDLILVWGAQRRIITGADLLGRLLRDIVTLERDETALPSKQI